MSAQSRRQQAITLIADIQSSIDRNNVVNAIPILKWTKDKIALHHSETERSEKNKASKAQGKSEFNARRVKRGYIYYANLGKNIGSEQNGYRPVIVVQNKMLNETSPTVIIVPLTDLYNKNGMKKRVYPTHVEISHSGLTKDSLAKMEYVRTISKNRLKQEVGPLDPVTLKEIDSKLKDTFDIV